MTEAERAALTSDRLASAPPPVLGDYPDWLDPHLARVFKEERGAEGAALASRAPLDMRVNTLKLEREEVLPMVAHLHAEPTRWSPIGLRIRLAADAKSPAIHAEPCFRKGAVEIQDEGSQLAALFAGAKPGEQVVDLAAGAGGKTLALAAVMENRGQIYATDIDKRQLAPIHERIARAGARNIQVRTPRGEADVLADLGGRIDLVLIDAPCTGTGVWRRNPDAKWRVRPGALAERVKQQEALLDRAAALLKAGGRIAYVTCSVLQEENGDQVRAFLSRHPDFTVVPPREIVAAALGERADTVLPRGAGYGGGPADDPADDRYRRLLCRRHAQGVALWWKRSRRALDPGGSWPHIPSSTPMHDTILIVDFGSQVTKLIARRIREESVYCEIVPFQKAEEAFRALRPKGVILSGGPASVLDKDAPLAPMAIYQAGVPVLGICYGEQAMAQQLGGKVEGGHHREFGRAEVEVTKPSALYDGVWEVGQRYPVWMSHGDRVTKPPEGFVATGTSANAPIAMIADEKRKFYATQFHLEVMHTPHGAALIRNFVRNIAGCSGDWTMRAFKDEAIEKIRRQVGKGRVICGLSGGVDSAVAAVLIHEAIGDQLTCVFVDHGLLRLGEGERVVALFRGAYNIPLVHVAAEELFLKALDGVD